MKVYIKVINNCVECPYLVKIDCIYECEKLSNEIYKETYPYDKNYTNSVPLECPLQDIQV